MHLLSAALKNVFWMVHIHGPNGRDEGVALAEELVVAELIALLDGVIVGSPVEPAGHV